MLFRSILVGAEATLKRFWKNVDIEKRDGGYAVTLDKRPLKTPSGKRLIIPPEKRLVAALIASEWENQQTLLKPHALPMVRPYLIPNGQMNSQQPVDVACVKGDRCL